MRRKTYELRLTPKQLRILIDLLDSEDVMFMNSARKAMDARERKRILQEAGHISDVVRQLREQDAVEPRADRAGAG